MGLRRSPEINIQSIMMYNSVMSLIRRSRCHTLVIYTSDICTPGRCAQGIEVDALLTKPYPRTYTPAVGNCWKICWGYFLIKKLDVYCPMVYGNVWYGCKNGRDSLYRVVPLDRARIRNMNTRYDPVMILDLSDSRAFGFTKVAASKTCILCTFLPY